MMELKRMLEKWYEIKFRGIMGSETDDIKEVTILGRRLRWTQEGLEYEGLEAQAGLMKKHGWSEESKAAVSAVAKETGGLEDDDDTKLEEEEDAKACRGRQR